MIKFSVAGVGHADRSAKSRGADFYQDILVDRELLYRIYRRNAGHEAIATYSYQHGDLVLGGLGYRELIPIDSDLEFLPTIILENENKNKTTQQNVQGLRMF